MSASHLQQVDDASRSPAAATDETPVKSQRVSTKAASSARARAKALPKSDAPASSKAARTSKREPVAADVMHSPAIYCKEHDSLNEAARLMWEHDIGALPVVNQEHRPIGMITDRDACMAAYTQGLALYHGSVASAMSKTLVICDISSPIAEIRELMTHAQVRRLPVVDASGTLVGVVGLSDIVKEAHAPVPKDRRRGTSGPMLLQLVDAILQPTKAD